MLGTSEAIRRVRELIERFAPSEHHVLITGESGTGKELVARKLHEQSGRAAGPYVAVNCATFGKDIVASLLFGSGKGAYTNAIEKPGFFEEADGGTLFLDEVGELSLEAQANLLRAIENGEVFRVGGTKPIKVNTRVISATNRDLGSLVKSGEFRGDLLGRLKVLQIRTPPLRARMEDIEPLARYFVGRAAQKGLPMPRIEPSFIKELERLEWRNGNIRELQNTVVNAVAMVHGAPLIKISPEENFADVPPATALEAALQAFHDDHDGDITDVSRRTSKRVLHTFNSACSGSFEFKKVRDIGRTFSMLDPRGFACTKFPPKLAGLLEERSPEFKEWYQRVGAAAVVDISTSTRVQSPSYTSYNDGRLKIKQRFDALRLDKLYTYRQIEEDVDRFLSSHSSRMFVIADRAGAGKSTFVLSKAHRLGAEGFTTILISGSDITGSCPSGSKIEHAFAQTHALQTDGLGWRSEAAPVEVWSRLLEQRGQRPLVVVIDAINESPEPLHVLRDALEALLVRISNLPVKVILTCRIETWSLTTEGLDRICDQESTQCLIYGLGEVDIRQGSARLGGANSALGSFGEDEFENAWREYSKLYRISGHPVLEAKEALRRPLIMSMFCKVNEGRQLGDFGRMRSWDVLRSYAKRTCSEVRDGLPPSACEPRVIDEWFDHFFMELGYRALENGDLVLSDDAMLMLLEETSPTCLGPHRSALQTAALSGLVSSGLLERRLHGCKISFDVLTEFYAGRRLADRGLYHGEARFSRYEYSEIVKSLDTVPLSIAEVLHHAVLEREAISADYIDLLVAMAESGPSLQEAACETVLDLQVVCFDPHDCTRPAMRATVDRNRGSRRLRALLGLQDLHSGERDHGFDEEVERLREAEIRNLIESVLGRIPRARDFVVGFVLKQCLSHLAERRPRLVEEQVLRWLRQGSGFLEKSIALGVVPLLPSSAVIEQLLEAQLEPGVGFWLQRSAAEAAVGLVENLGEPSSMELFEQFEGLLRRRIHETRAALVYRAMFCEKYIRLRAAVHHVPGALIADELRVASWGAVSCLRALHGVVAERRRYKERGDGAERDVRRATTLIESLRQWVLELEPQRLLDAWQASDDSWPLIHSLQLSLEVLLRELGCPLEFLFTSKERSASRSETTPSVAVMFCFEFLAGSLRDHPECKERVYAILLRLEALRKRGDFDFDYVEAVQATFSQLTARTHDNRPLHSPSYVDAVKQVDMAFETGDAEWHLLRGLELRPGSWRAAYWSAGALVRAVELVERGEYRSVLCANRPPGHLAGNRICVFDNIAVAALQAASRGRRVFIFDADAHHGLHLQESFYRDHRVMYCSIHESKVHPGQGYPHQIGAARRGGMVCDGIGTTLNISLDADPDIERSCATYLAAFRDWIVPAAQRFVPDIVFIAGGADADHRDPFSNLKLRPECAYEVARTLAGIAATGVVVSLEGGYEVDEGLADWWEAFSAGLSSATVVEQARHARTNEQVGPIPKEVEVFEVLRRYEPMVLGWHRADGAEGDGPKSFPLGQLISCERSDVNGRDHHFVGSGERGLAWAGSPAFVLRVCLPNSRRLLECLQSINMACEIDVSALGLVGVAYDGPNSEPFTFVGVILRGEGPRARSFGERVGASELDRNVRYAVYAWDLPNPEGLLEPRDFETLRRLTAQRAVGVQRLDSSMSTKRVVVGVWPLDVE